MENEKNELSYTNEKKSAFIELFRTGMIYFVAVLQYIKGILPLANFTLFAGAAKQMTYSIWQILQGAFLLFRASDYFDDYLKYMEIEESSDNAESGFRDTNIPFIEFCNVSFRYPKQEDYAVRNLSFTVLKGETIAFVGNNGAGKSTVIKLLLRLYPATEGEILLYGKSIYAYNLEEYRSFFAPVFQDFMLYSFTIRENILFDRKMDDVMLNDLLRKVELDKRISELQKGVDTACTKRFEADGVEFSGGEAQKLVIARALAHNGMIVVLDEPTAALDPLSEYAIYELIYRLRENHTTFFVSHRLNTTRLSSKILVLDQGRLVEEGDHDTLLNMKGLYFSMFNMQKHYYEQREEK